MRGTSLNGPALSCLMYQSVICLTRSCQEPLLSAYSKPWFVERQDRSRRSAERIVPLVLAERLARSVVDVGCGTADWLAAFRAHGVEDVLGFDGEYVDRRRLAIPEWCFCVADLRRPMPDVGRRFDLAVSLEVAEHLPPERADGFVADLTRLSDAVLFSAAIPLQGGVGHVNEQWPGYWAERFARHGFFPRDIFRLRLWNDDQVAFWYAQNLLLYVKGEPPCSVPALVHPACYLQLAERGRAREVLRSLPRLACKALLRRLRRTSA